MNQLIKVRDFFAGVALAVILIAGVGAITLFWVAAVVFALAGK